MTITSSSLLKRLSLVILIIASLYIAKPFLVPLTIGAIISTLFLPLSKLFERRGLARWLSVLFCMIVLLISITTIGTLLGWQIAGFTSDLALIKLKVLEVISNMRSYAFTHLNITVNEQNEILKGGQSSATDMLQSLFGSMIRIVSQSILVLVYVFLLLYYRDHLKEFILKLTASNQRKDMEQVLTNATKISQQYLLGMSKMIVCLWVMYSIGFSLVGVSNPISFAILCGMLEIVPFIGNITGTSITVLASAAQGASLGMIGGIILTYGIVQLIQGWFLEPLVLGAQVKINPLFTILALVVGDLVWGIAGIVLAIPITAIIKIICEHIDKLRPFGFLIGELELNKKKIIFGKSFGTKAGIKN